MGGKFLLPIVGQPGEVGSVPLDTLVDEKKDCIGWGWTEVTATLLLLQETLIFNIEAWSSWARSDKIRLQGESHDFATSGGGGGGRYRRDGAHSARSYLPSFPFTSTNHQWKQRACIACLATWCSIYARGRGGDLTESLCWFFNLASPML